MSTEARKIIPLSLVPDAFKQSETLFRALIENSSDALALLTDDGTYLYVSPSVQKFLGFTPEELVGHNGFELIPSEQLAFTTQQFEKVLQTPGLPIVVEHQYFHKDGSIRWLESTVTNLLGDSNVQAIVSNFRDITERRRAEERQRLLNEVSRILVSSFDHRITLKEVAELIVPTLADYCRIALLDEHQQIQEISVNHIDPDKIALVQALYDEYKDRPNSTHGLQKLLETGKPELISTLSSSILEPVQENTELLRIVGALDLHSYMGVPLIARDRIIGAITFSSIQPHRYYGQDDFLFAQEVARRIA